MDVFLKPELKPNGIKRLCGLIPCTLSKFLNIICFPIESTFRERRTHADNSIIICVMVLILILKLDIGIWFHRSISVTLVNVRLTLKTIYDQYTEIISILNLKTWELNYDKFIKVINALYQNTWPSIDFPRPWSNLMMNCWPYNTLLL